MPYGGLHLRATPGTVRSTKSTVLREALHHAFDNAAVPDDPAREARGHRTGEPRPATPCARFAQSFALAAPPRTG
jgi:hypothetical protein